jgi:hypothetical protein
VTLFQDAIKVVKSLSPVACHVLSSSFSVSPPQSAVIVVDFGQNIAGRLKLHLPLPSHEQCREKTIADGRSRAEHFALRILHSELLHANGSLNTVTLGTSHLSSFARHCHS